MIDWYVRERPELPGYEMTKSTYRALIIGAYVCGFLTMGGLIAIGYAVWLLGR